MTVYRSGKTGAGSKWRGEFTHPVTKERVRAPHLFATKAEGQEWEREEKAKIHSSGGEYRGPSKTTLRQFVESTWRPQRNVARSTSDRDRALIPRLAPLLDQPLQEIKRSTVNAWIKALEDAGESPHVVRESLWLLSGMMKLAVADGLRSTNPAAGATFTAPMPHEDRILTDDEVDLIAQQLAGGDRLLVWVLAYTGLRFGEAAALGEKYFDRYEKVIHVRWTMDKRTGKLKRLKGSDAAYRTVPVATWLSSELVTWLPLRPNPDAGWFFQGARGARIRYDNWRKRTWEPALASARIAEPQPTPHDLRHFFGTKLGAAGVGESNIAALMGHSATSRITRRYVQPTRSRIDQAREVMGG